MATFKTNEQTERTNPMRKPLIVGAQKLFLNLDEASRFAGQLVDHVTDRNYPFELVVCPSFINLATVSPLLAASKKLSIGAQNVHQERNGAFTGQVAIGELMSVGVRYIIVGHSELRTQQNETNEMVNEKVKLCLRYGITPIICVGETAEERADGRTEEVIERDVRGTLSDLSKEEIERVVIAYEPVWAIKRGRPGTQAATPDVAEEIHQLIRSWLVAEYGIATAEKVRILYGGSVNSSNSNDMLKQPDIDGLLIGSASRDIETFQVIIDNAASLLQQPVSP